MQPPTIAGGRSERHYSRPLCRRWLSQGARTLWASSRTRHRSPLHGVVGLPHPVRRTVVQRLDVASVPPSTWDVPVSPGYRLAQWVGSTPDDLLAEYAAARLAIQDAPASEASYRQPNWTPERIRQSEQELAEQGTEERVVVAIDEAGGQIVGVTSMLFYPHRPDYGYQNDTSVVGAHRGHGLGVAMKSAMMRWIRVERPQVGIVLTTTAKANEHMIDVNLRVGYKTLRSIIYVETTVEGLDQEWLGAVHTAKPRSLRPGRGSTSSVATVSAMTVVVPMSRPSATVIGAVRSAGRARRGRSSGMIASSSACSAPEGVHSPVATFAMICCALVAPVSRRYSPSL